MAKQYVGDYLVDSGWDGNYFYIHKDNFDSSFQPDNNDMRAFMRALLHSATTSTEGFVASDKPKKMVLSRNVSINNSTLNEGFSANFTANINTSGSIRSVAREPFKVVITSLTDNMDGTAEIVVEPISAGDPMNDFLIAVGYVASTGIKVPTFDTDYDVVDGYCEYNNFNTATFTLDEGIGTWYVTPWMYAYDSVKDTEYNFYGPTKTIRITGACFVEGTKITLADGSQKNVENLTYDDNLLVWNFDEGKSDSAKPVWLSVKQPYDMYSKVTFADGTVLNSISPVLGHRIYGIEHNS